MNRLLSTLALISIGSLGLGAGCAPKPVSSQSDTENGMGRDSVVVPGVGEMPNDLVRTGDITLNAPALFVDVSVAELMMLQATTLEQVASAEAAISSGAYLGNPVRVVRVTNDDSQGVISNDVETDLGTSFQTEFVVRFQEAGGDVAFEVVGEPMQAGRRMPSMFRVMFSLEGGDAVNGVVVVLGDEGAEPSEQGWVELPGFSPDEYAHRIGIRYEPGLITVEMNGEIVLEEVARLGGGNATAAILARPAETAYVLSWTFETQP